MTRKHSPYVSYLLRLWQVRNEGAMVWHASLESPETHRQQGFGSLEALYQFLCDQVSLSAGESEGDGEKMANTTTEEGGEITRM